MKKVKSVIKKYITNDGTIRASSVVATNVVEEARLVHQSFPVATAALGRALVGAGLLASFMKDRAKLALHFKGDGPLGQVFAEGSSEGHVRGFVANSQIHVPSRNGKLNVGGGVGKGVLSVATSLPKEKQPYTGTVDLQTGEIGDDIAFYLFQSQQIPSIVALGVFVEPDNSVSAAGGTIIQTMPGVTDQTLSYLEERVKKLRPVSEMIKSGATAEDLALEILEDLKFQELHDGTEMIYKCNCDTDRVDRALLLMGADELSILLQKNEPAEVTCDFCGRRYEIPKKHLQELLNRSKSH